MNPNLTIWAQWEDLHSSIALVCLFSLAFPYLLPWTILLISLDLFLSVCLPFCFALNQQSPECLDCQLCRTIILCYPWEGALVLKVLLMLTGLNLAAVQHGPLSDHSNLRPNTYFAKHTWASLVGAVTCVSFREALPRNVCSILQVTVARSKVYSHLLPELRCAKTVLHTVFELFIQLHICTQLDIYVC